MNASEITMYEMLKAKFGEKEATTFVTAYDEKIEKRFEDAKDVLSSKKDLADLKTELVEKIANNLSDIIKWMFIFWIGQLASFITIAKFFFH